MSQWVDQRRTPSSKNKSDILTKPMDAQTLQTHLHALGFWLLSDARLALLVRDLIRALR